MKKADFAEGEFYHIYNRGVDKRDIFQDQEDLERFFESMDEFNVQACIGSIYENSFRKQSGDLSSKNLISKRKEQLVHFVAFCLNPNHYHFICTPLVEKGIEKFMHKLGTGYTNYFNEKNNRAGALFQGRYKGKHVSSDQYLRHLSVYVNLNNQLGSSTPKLSYSSWEEYIGDTSLSFCKKDIILNEFSGKNEYKKFALSNLKDIILRKERDKELRDLLME